MGDDVQAPEPTSEERALQAEQAQTLREQREFVQSQVKRQSLLDPILFKQAGLEPQFGEDGEITGFNEVEDPLQARRDEVEEGFLDRTLQAQRGELPISGVTERSIEGGREELRDRLRKQLGTGFEISSPGAEALTDFEDTATARRSAEARGDLTVAAQLGLAQTGSNEGIDNQSINQALGIQSGAGARVGDFTQVAGGFGSAQQAGQFTRGLQFQADTGNANRRNQTISSALGAVGTLGGIAAGIKFS